MRCFAQSFAVVLSCGVVCSCLCLLRLLLIILRIVGSYLVKDDGSEIQIWLASCYSVFSKVLSWAPRSWVLLVVNIVCWHGLWCHSQYWWTSDAFRHRLFVVVVVLSVSQCSRGGDLLRLSITALLGTQADSSIFYILLDFT